MSRGNPAHIPKSPDLLGALEESLRKARRSDADYEQQYLHDPVFHAEVEVGAQAIMQRWQRESVLNSGPTDEAWSQARLLAFTVLKAVDAAAVRAGEETA